MTARKTDRQPAPSMQACTRHGIDECEHQCVHYEGHCYEMYRLGCEIECPSEWCPFCIGDRCRTHGERDGLLLSAPCGCDTVERHEREAKP